MRRGRYLFLLLIFSSLAAQEGGGEWESLYRDGVLAEELLSDESGRPLESRYYEKEFLQEIRSYAYGDRMQTVDVRHYSRDGKEEIWKEVLYLREDGSVRMMEKSEGDRTVVSGWSARTEWTRGERDQEIFTYGPAGEIRERVLFHGSEVGEEEFFSYDGAGLLISSELISAAERERTITRYTAAGLPGEVRYYRKGLLAREVRNTYNDQGLLVHEERRGEGLLTERSLGYGPDGELVEERFYRNGLITRKILYRDEDRTEEIYSKGRLTLRVRYSGMEIVSEEKIQ